MPIDPAATIKAAIKFNPHLWGPDELRAIFVVRQNELAQITDTLRAAAPDRVPQHLLITGHRGMGKSTLLQRLALAIGEEPELDARWLPLTFPEEQYTVRTLSEFWRNVLDALADALERRGASPVDLATLDAEVRRIGTLPGADAEAAALALLDAWVAQHHRGLVLLVDGSDLLLNALAQGEAAGQTDFALWRLRKALSHHAGLFWIGASYQALEAHHDYGDAFHDFFALHELRPLSVAEMRTALLALARQFGAGRGLQGAAAEAEMAAILDTRPERLEALRLLSGGNPRTTVTLYELFAAGGDDSIQADLKRLLDIMTPLYKARMDALTDQPRKIFAHLMEQWHPVGVRELAAEAQIPNTTVSGQLSRLENEGLIEKAPLPGGAKRSGYQASERLFNVWYLMRHGSRRVRQRLAWAVEFMRLWFNRDELADLAGSRARGHARGELSDGGSLEFSRAIVQALGDDQGAASALEWSVFALAQRQAQQSRCSLLEAIPGLFDLEGEDRPFRDADDYLARFAALDAPLAVCPHVVGEEERGAWVKAVKSSCSLSLPEKEQIARAAATLSPFQVDKLRRIFQDEAARWVSHFGEPGAKAVLAAVGSGAFFPDCPDSRIAFAQMEHLFSGEPQAYQFALELLAAKHQNQWVERAFRHAVSLSAEPAPLWNRLGNLLQVHLKSYEEAEAAYRRAIALDEKLAYPWNNLGGLLQDQLKRYEEAEAAYRRAIALDEKYATPWNNLGNLLQDQLKRYEEAEAAYRRAIALDEKDGYPWANLARLQALRQAHDEAAESYRQALRLLPEDGPATGGQELRLQAQLWLGNRDSAAQALAALAQAAAAGDAYAFYRLREQCRECAEIGLAPALAELMEQSPWADFLLPFSLALAAWVSGQAPVGAAPEILALATEMLDEMRAALPVR